MPAAMMSLTVWPGGLDGIEGGQQRLHHFGPLDDAQRDLGGHAQRAFGADKDAGAGRSRVHPASAEPKLDEFAVGQHDFEGQHMGDGKAVFQAMRARRSFPPRCRRWCRPIARRDRARRNSRSGATRWVTCALMTPGSTTTRWLAMSTSRMRFMRARLMTMPPCGGQRSAAQAGAGAAADKGNFVPGADADHCLHLLGGARQHHSAGEHAEIGEAVALIGLQLVGRGDEAVVTDGGAQFGNLGGEEHGWGIAYPMEGRMGDCMFSGYGTRPKWKSSIHLPGCRAGQRAHPGFRRR